MKMERRGQQLTQKGMADNRQGRCHPGAATQGKQEHHTPATDIQGGTSTYNTARSLSGFAIVQEAIAIQGVEYTDAGSCTDIRQVAAPGIGN